MQAIGGGADSFSVTKAFTAWTVALPVAISVGVLAAGYLLGLLALRRRGAAWPPGRTSMWLLGLLLTAFSLMGGLGSYDDSVFSAHMMQHMLLAMVAPIPLALGAPVTLLLRTLPSRSQLRGDILRLLHSRLSRVLTNPVLAFGLFIGSNFAVYFTGIYPYTLAHPWAHQLLHLHLLLTGCLFAWIVVGIDPLPHRPGYGLRMLIVVATLPFHAFLGIALMTQDTVIAQPHYLATGTPLASLLADQRTGAGLLWASGEFIGLALVFSVMAQWMHSEERTAVRVDRRLDREEAAAVRAEAVARLAERDASEDAALEVYNTRLAALQSQP